MLKIINKDDVILLCFIDIYGIKISIINDIVGYCVVK